MELIVRRREAGAPSERLRLEPAGGAAAAGSYEVVIEGRTHHVDVAGLGPGHYSIRLGGAQHELIVRPGGSRGDGWYQVSAATGTTSVEVADPLAHLAAQTTAAAQGGRRRQRITAYMPGRVVALLAAEGEAVQAGQGILVLEAMKMQNEIVAEHEGTLTRLLVEPGQSVDGGDPLFELE